MDNDAGLVDAIQIPRPMGWLSVWWKEYRRIKALGYFKEEQMPRHEGLQSVSEVVSFFEDFTYLPKTSSSAMYM